MSITDISVRVVTAVAVCLALGVSPTRATAPTPDAIQAPVTPATLGRRLDTFVPAAMTTLGVVPGLAMAVVRGGDVIYEGTFGVAEIRRSTPVTAETMFYTASLAKAFTGMAAAVLATRGTLDLDAPLTRVFPGLRLPQGADAKKATVRGLLAHDPGFGNATINYVTTFIRPYETDADLLRVLNTYSQPVERFTYANSNYALLGYVIERVTGKPWRDVVAETVFVPLGMNHTTAFVSRARNLAQPYVAEATGFVLMPLQKTDRTITGAGGVYSTARDLAKFVEASLNGGRVDGRQALPEAAVQLARTSLVSAPSTYTYYRRTGYGMGLYQGDYDGEPMPHHFGSISGYKAHLSFMPQRGVGVVVLGNEGDDGARFTDLVASYAYDVLLGRDADSLAAARIAEYQASITRARTQRAGRRDEWKALSDSPGTVLLPLPAYVGRYRSDRLGDLELTHTGRQLVIHFGDLQGTALPVAGHDYLVNWGLGGPPERWTFSVVDGRVVGFDWGGRLFNRVQ